MLFDEYGECEKEEEYGDANEERTHCWGGSARKRQETGMFVDRKERGLLSC